MNTINLTKNETINLTKTQDEVLNLAKTSNSLRSVVFGLGWDEANQPAPAAKSGLFGRLFSSSNGGNSGSSDDFDLDASLILCRNGKATKNDDLIYYGHLDHPSGAVHHCGDNLTGAGEGDDEQIVVNFAKLPSDVDKIVIFVNIYSAVSRHQHFGMIANAFVRAVDKSTGKEMCRYNLSENYNGCTAMIFGELNKVGNEWMFTAVGQGTNDTDIPSIVRRYQ